MKRNQPIRLDPMRPEHEARHPAPTGNGNVALQGFERLSTADPRTGIRRPTGGTPQYPPYHEDE